MNRSLKKNSEWFSQAALHIILITACVLCLLPFVVVLSTSISDEYEILKKGYSLFPRNFTLFTYKYLLESSSSIVNSYLVTVFVTVTGTIISLLLTSMFAYPLSRRDFKHSNFFSFFVFFTMLFNGGLVPFYILIVQYLKLKDNILVLIIPYLITPMLLLILRNFFKTIPDSIIESAKIDGAGEWRILFRIVLPLSKPSLATIGLFNALMYWNDWWLALLFIENQKYIPLQYLLYSTMENIRFISMNAQTRYSQIKLPGETARMAICIIAVGPIILAYPFFQKYIIKGLTMGAVKG